MSRPETITSEYVRGFRAGESSALERAAQIARGVYLGNLSSKDGVRSEIALQIERALASPAAAPAAETCRAECASRMPDYSHYECTLPRGHVGPHKEGSFAEWTDATTVVAPSLLPRVLAALETCAVPGRVSLPSDLRALASELRRYIAEMEGKT